MKDSLKKTLFVAMPFGKKTACLDSIEPSNLVTIDFDRVWEKILAPGIPSDFNALRADETRVSGIIDKVYIEHLLNADVVLADLTFANPNVYYELGIRHALCKGGTVLVVQAGANLPFDVKKLKVLFYDRADATSLGDFQDQLRSTILKAVPHETESPVHVFLPGLFVCKYDHADSPDKVIAKLKEQVDELEKLVEKLKGNAAQTRLLDQIEKMTKRQDILVTYHQLKDTPSTSLHIVEKLGIKLREHGCFKEAIQLFSAALAHHGPDATILRELGFCHRKLGPEHFAAAAEYFFAALKIRPFDPELRGMIGGMYKRQKEYQKALEQYREANADVPDDLYTLVNLGAVSAILNLEEDARRHYDDVIRVCQSKMAAGTADHWTHICRGEASVYLGDETNAIKAYQVVVDSKPPVEDMRSAFEQLEYFTKHPSIESLAQKIIDMLQAYINQHAPTA
jgi:tetratricopeptide (TPR) repeat protein